MTKISIDSYGLSVIQRDSTPLLQLAQSHDTWWPEDGFDTFLSVRTSNLFENHWKYNLRMPMTLAAVERGECSAYQQKTPRERVIAALTDCVKRETASRFQV